MTPKPSALGHDKVSVLDGGLPRWIAEGGEVEVGGVGDIAESEYESSKDIDKALVRCESKTCSDRAFHTNALESRAIGSTSVLCTLLTPRQLAYEQVVANARKNLEDVDAEIVLDARAHGR